MNSRRAKILTFFLGAVLVLGLVSCKKGRPTDPKYPRLIPTVVLTPIATETPTQIANDGICEPGEDDSNPADCLYALCEATDPYDDVPKLYFGCAVDKLSVCSAALSEDGIVVELEGYAADQFKDGGTWFDGLYFSPQFIPQGNTIYVEIVAQRSQYCTEWITPGVVVYGETPGTGYYNIEVARGDDIITDTMATYKFNVTDFINSGGKRFVIIPNPSGAAILVDAVRLTSDVCGSLACENGVGGCCWYENDVCY